MHSDCLLQVAYSLILEMEGGTLPWKTQKIVNNSPDLESYCKPLPPPPSGFKWEQQPDESWILLEVKETPETSPTVVRALDPCVIEHYVMPSDTIQGICLKYKVSAIDLRRVNLFSGNNIKYFKTLKIPIAAGVQFQIQEDDPEMKIRRFCDITNEGPVEARLYLEDHEWNVNKAVAQWETDENWHLTAVQQAVSIDNCVVPAAVVYVNENSSRPPEYVPTPDGDEGVQMLSVR